MINFIMNLMSSAIAPFCILAIAVVLILIAMKIGNEKASGRAIGILSIIIVVLLAICRLVYSIVSAQVGSETHYQQTSIPVSTWGKGNGEIQVLTKDHKVIKFDTEDTGTEASQSNNDTDIIVSGNNNKLEYHYSIKNKKTNVKLVKCTARNANKIKQYRLQDNIALKYYKFVINKPLTKDN